MTTEQLANALERLEATAARLDGVSRIVNEITTLHRETADQTGSMAGHWPTTTFA